MSKTVEIKAVWVTYHTVEVPDDMDDSTPLNEWPEDILEELTPDAAALHDWEIY